MQRHLERDGNGRWPGGRTRLDRAVRETDWRATRLGPIEDWPVALRMAAGLVLDSHFAQNLMWGAELVQLYNDAFVRILGARHPTALGQPAAECWPELWDEIGPGIRGVMQSGVATSREHARYTIVSEGVPEERYFTFSWSPVRDLDGRVVGVLNTVIELSSTVRTVQEGERRLTEALGEIGRWQAVFDQAPALLAVTEGPAHRIAVTNAAYRALVGDRPLAGLRTIDALPELAAQGFVAQLDAAWRSGEPVSATDARLMLQRARGVPLAERHVDYVLQPLKGADARVTGILLVGVDASERHVAQRARDDAEERARMALMAASMGVWRHDRATDLIELDAIAREHYDVDAPVVSREAVLARVHAEDRDALHLEMAAARDAAVRAPVSIEYRVVDRNGRIRWISISGRVLFDDSRGRGPGPWIRAVGTSRDVTAHKLAEQALRASESDFRSLFELSAVGVAQADPDTGRFTRVNRRFCELTGHTEAELLRRRVADLTHPEDRPAELATLAPLFRGERDEWSLEKRYVRADGSTIWVYVAGRFVRDRDGGLRRTIAGVIDITARRQAEAALREAEQALRENDRLKDEYLMTLAHELRGPLAPIRTALGLFERETLSDPGRQALAMSKRQLHQLTRLVDDLLEASRAMRGMIEIRAEPMMVQHVVHAAAEAVAPLLDERRQPVRLAMPGAPLRIVADPVRLAQVVENLLTNASKYSDPGSPIEIRVEGDGAGVAIEVADRGVGIAPEQLPRLFTLFAQLDTTLDRSRGGLGIGLHLVRRLVELHGGTVSAHSDGPGRGARFRVELPVRRSVPAGPG